MANLEVFERKVLGNELKCCFRKKPNNSPLHLPIKLMCSCQLSRKLENREKKKSPFLHCPEKTVRFWFISFSLFFFFHLEVLYSYFPRWNLIPTLWKFHSIFYHEHFLLLYALPTWFKLVGSLAWSRYRNISVFWLLEYRGFVNFPFDTIMW